MKLAYLIIAHNEFEVLRRLVAALDDSRCDIFIHFDAKVEALPEIRASKSRLYILDNRVNVKWGTVSQIRSEYALWEEAVKYGPYSHYVLLSGTHFPLMSCDGIVTYFDCHSGMNLIPDMGRANDYQIDMKMRRYNFRPGTFFWRAMLKVQRILHIRCNRDVDFFNGGNWTSLTQDAVQWLLENKKRILRRYRWTFCGDEFFVPTELLASHLRESVEFSRDLLKFEIGRSNAREYTIDDYKELVDCGCAFVRKITSRSISLIDLLAK